MKTGGFRYTGVGDTARCDSCGLEVSGWIQNTDPFNVHLERNPNCTFVRFVQSKTTLILNHENNSTKQMNAEYNIDQWNRQNKLFELDILKQVRQRTFSNWPHETTLMKEQMIIAGFFHCNVGDRVICLYCNLICQQWQENIDDPVEIHKTLSPMCPYVLFKLTRTEPSSVSIVNEISTDNIDHQATLLNNNNQVRFEQIVYTSPCHIAYISIPSRQATFEIWANESSPAIDDLVKAGFFYTGIENIVTCFYCNGSLKNWGENDNPLIEHIRWFPHCAYAKQLSGPELHDKIQKAKSIQEVQGISQTSTNQMNNSSVSNHQRLQINDENLLSRLVTARLDLSISQRLLNQNFKLSVIKRCWEDQLRLKHDDFVSDCDLFIACIILQKQIEHIGGNKNNIIIPSVKMKLIRDRQHSDTLTQEEHVSPSLPITSTQASSKMESMEVETANQHSKTDEPISDSELSLNHPCILCGKEEKRLACVPCGHLVSCVSCYQKFRTCPKCHREIEAFVRIYI
ncbi:unnamed protein product [Rotaria sordida]|uniref:RING-type domain-containing protein n=1 Tax=Rotaria sordida TaxID=392033 RepID=A0A814VA12_9BILA|nr:unnamed protein product [Rotaria sordida]